MKKYILILSGLLLSGCNQSYQDMKHVDCTNFSNRHIITVHTGISGSDRIIKAMSGVIGNDSICGWINQEIDKYCTLGNVSQQKIQGKMTISAISNPHLVQYLGSGGKRSGSDGSINFSNRNTFGKRNNYTCNFHNKQNSISLDTKNGVVLTKIHRKGLKLYIKYNKSRYIDVMNSK